MRFKTTTIFHVPALMAMLAVVVWAFGCGQGSGPSSQSSQAEVELVQDEAGQKVDVLFDGKLFTSYLYSDKLTVLKKPVLYPIVTANGNHITRGFPLEQRAGERVDHPHHIGFWLNYGDVNGLDFWNNSDAISAERAAEMGTIKHREIMKMQSGKQGELEVVTDWLNPDGDRMLLEETRFVFMEDAGVRIIERTTTLTALDEKVLFEDNKEGMVAVRVTRALELPSDRPAKFTDASGKPTDVPVLDNEGVTGNYLSSEGITGMDVWSTRAKWVTLQGIVNGEKVAVSIFDNPGNPGFPTYWHARGYGLFSANPLGQKVFSKGAEALHFALNPGESTTFRYRLSVRSGETSAADLETEYQTFVGTN